MSSDNPTPEDQAIINQLAQGAMQQLAAGRSAEEVSRDLQTGGLAKSTADGLVEHVAQRWQEIAAAPRQNAEAYFRTKYPEMRPVRSSPSLFTVHGIGMMLYGQRDRDAATGTFVKTHSLCVFFIPVLALSAYRVAPSGGGWTLIGRVPLSRFARWWNLLLPLAIAAVIGLGVWDAAQHGPAAAAAKKLARADEAAAAGDLLGASRLYADVARGHRRHAVEARDRLAKLVERPELDRLPMLEVAEIFDQVIPAMLSGGPSQEVAERGLAIVKLRAKSDPAGSVTLLRHVSMLSHDKASQTFVELARGPLAALPAAETVAIFRTAAQIPQDAQEKSAFAAVAKIQCGRLAATDLPAAFELLSIVATLDDQTATDDCLATLLGDPFSKAPCAAVGKAVAIAKGKLPPAGEKKLFDAAMAWVGHHPQTDRKELLALLDQLGSLGEADTSRVAAARRPLLESLVAADPQDVDLTVQLAEAIEAEGSALPSGATGKDDHKDDPTARIVKLLTPLRDKLGTGEGARVLGQALAAQGKYDDSYALLGPYLDQHLDAFHEAEQAYRNAAEQVRRQVENQVRSGTAPGFNAARVEQLSDKKFDDMAAEYESRQMKEDAGVNAARENLARLGRVVPAALDLGMVTLQRAQAMKDPAARKTELERAEKTFLAIRGTAGEADQYMLHLGQVYYWLGKQTEGQEEFDKLLKKHARTAEILYSVASVLRDLGSSAEARKLLEEAYEKAQEPKARQEVAYLRAITSKDLDDEILWLSRSDDSDYRVKAGLADSRGRRAESQGRDDEAAANYREAAAIYEARPVSTDVLNNGAMAYMQLYEVSGDRQALDRASQWLEKAVSLSPSDSVVLSNAASQMLRAAVQDLAGTQLDLRDLQMPGDFAALEYLAADQKALAELRRRARDHAGLRKGLNYLERASILSPKSQRDNLLALNAYALLRDRDALQRLEDRIVAAKPDTQENLADMLKYYHFNEDATTKDEMKSQMVRGQALVARLAAGAKGPAYAAAVDKLVDAKLDLPENEIDADELVRLAEDAHRAAPSAATYGPLIKALMHRAGKRLAADYSDYANATRGTERAVSASYPVALAIRRDDALGKSARENKDVQRAVALVVERANAFPETRDLWDWAVLAAAGPSQSELRAKCLVPDEVNKLAHKIDRLLAPYDPREAFEVYFQRRAAGDATARQPLDELVKLGVPLPVGLLQR